MRQAPSRLATLAVLLLALAACSPSRRAADGDPACSRPCGALCCGAGEACDEASGTCSPCEPTSCEAAGAACGTVDDGCGGTLPCGSCGDGETCGEAHRCVPAGCVPTTCAALGAACGTVDDGCGDPLPCGTCDAGEQCGGGGVAHRCGSGNCLPETDRAFCLRLGVACGPASDFDNCDRSREVPTCGSCGAGSRCEAGACVCVPESDLEFCRRLGKSCGTVAATDNCGRARSAACGSCGGSARCEANVCVAPRVGGPCVDDEQCAAIGGICLTHAVNGMCVLIGCDLAGNDCPAGSTCIDDGSATLCMEGPCRRDADCSRSAEGYICDYDGSCWSYDYVPAHPGGQPLAATCGSDLDCESGWCDTDLTPSVCGFWCSPRSSRPCPDGARCVDLQCRKSCTRTSECRTGWSCTEGVCVPP